MVFRDTSKSDLVDNVYHAKFDAIGGTWSAAPTLQVGIKSIFTPGIAISADAYHYLATVEDNGLPERIRIYRRSSSAVPWTLVTTPLLSANLATVGGVTISRDRLTLLSVPLRTGSGARFADGTQQLAVYWNEHSGGDTMKGEFHSRRAYQQGYISSSGIASFTGWSQLSPEGVSRPMPFQSVSAVIRWNEASRLYTGTIWDAGGVIDQPYYVPHATGAFAGATGHVDTDDALYISERMCETLWAMPKNLDAGCFCATLQPCPGVGYSVFPPEGPQCELGPPPF